MTTKILGTGSCLPAKVVTNDDLSKLVDTSDEWISSRTGIKSRHLVEDETAADLAYEAGKKALLDAGVSPEEIDLLIVGTFTGSEKMPSVACNIAGRLGCKNATSFDISAACSGFIFALSVAHSQIVTGLAGKALVVGAETLSKVVDWTDRSTCVLFGDGAGAAVLGASDTGIDSIVTGSDGVKGPVLTCTDFIEMNGQEVFKFAVSKVPECIGEVLEKAGCTADSIDTYVLHQANERIIASVAKRLGVTLEHFPMNLSQCGNTSAASVPILLDELNHNGTLKRGNNVVLAGFGGGLTWGAIKMVW